ncbi:MAG TPA: DUF1778 domain-containing protein [Chloroflexota bacterium]|jgi:uncharacterized protein (DUF1778 family)|nr:DUF1778 domain-containing protein [Chloroflexota bacterium]
MAVVHRHKRERLEARVTPEQKELLQRAAALEGTTVTEFVVSRAQRAAEQTIREHEILTLTARASSAFVEALLSPPAPNQTLRAASEHYRRVMAAQ